MALCVKLDMFEVVKLKLELRVCIEVAYTMKGGMKTMRNKKNMHLKLKNKKCDPHINHYSLLYLWAEYKMLNNKT